MKTGRNLQEVLVELDRQNKAKQDFISPAQGRWAHLRAEPSDHRPANDLRHHLAVPPSGGIGAGHPGQVLRPDAEPETGTAGGERERLVCGQEQLLHGAVYGLRLRAGRPCAVV